VAFKMMKDANSVFDTVKTNVITFFNTQKEKQALEHSLSRVERLFKNATDNSAVETIAEFESSLTNFWDEFNVQDIYTEVLSEFQKLIDNDDYDEILKIFNNKGMVIN